MVKDFSDINLYFSERLKLFAMRFEKQVTGDFLEPSLRLFLDYKLITAYYDFVDTPKSGASKKTLYSLTDRYFRYCLYRRRKFFDSKIWPFIISIVSAIVTAVITAYITALSVLQ